MNTQRRQHQPASDQRAYFLDRLPLHRPDVSAEHPTHAGKHVAYLKPGVLCLPRRADLTVCKKQYP